MSETELFKGKLKEFAREPDETFQNYVERFIKEKKKKIPSSYQRKLSEKDVEEMFRDVFYKEHGVLIDKIIYEIVQINEFDNGDDIFEASRQQDGSIDFVLQYYNGGCSFTEALETAFRKMKYKKQKVQRSFK